MDSNPDTVGNPQDLEDQFDGETAGNSRDMEMQFAEKTAEYLNVCPRAWSSRYVGSVLIMTGI
jgi:hypothetical protein